MKKTKLFILVAILGGLCPLVVLNVNKYVFLHHNEYYGNGLLGFFSFLLTPTNLFLEELFAPNMTIQFNDYIRHSMLITALYWFIVVFIFAMSKQNRIARRIVCTIYALYVIALAIAWT